MSILNDKEIIRLCNDHNMISPFEEESIRENKEGTKVLSYGVSSFGYDVRIGEDVKVFVNINGSIVDMKNFDESHLITPKIMKDRTGTYVIIPPNGFALGSSVEYIKMPSDVVGICQGKSTAARAGMICPPTPLENGWEGNITLEFCNTTPLPSKLYLFEGCSQILFFRGEAPMTTYATRGGKYMGQTGITHPRV